MLSGSLLRITAQGHYSEILLRVSFRALWILVSGSAIDNAAHAASRISFAIISVSCQPHSKCSDETTLSETDSTDAFLLRQT